MSATTGPGVAEYVAAVPDRHRPLFDRVDPLLRTDRPDVEVAISYRILRYARAGSRVYLGVWAHGVSLYGWARDADGGFGERHPELLTGRGTLKLRARDADGLSDAEFLALFAGALGVAAP